MLLAPLLSQLWQDWITARIGDGNPDRIKEVIHRSEAALGKGFASWFLTGDHYGRQLLIATVADPEFRARLLAGSIASDLPTDSAAMMIMKAASRVPGVTRPERPATPTPPGPSPAGWRSVTPPNRIGTTGWPGRHCSGGAPMMPYGRRGAR